MKGVKIDNEAIIASSAFGIWQGVVVASGYGPMGSRE